MKKRGCEIPHQFGKCMVVWCVAMGSLCSLWALGVLSHTGQDGTGLLTVILGFFGGELGLMFGKSALERKKEVGQSDGRENV